MLNINVNNKFDFHIDLDESSIIINGQPVVLDVQAISKDHYHTILNNRSYTVEIVDFNKLEKTCVVKVNSNTYTLQIKDQNDELLQQLGLDKLTPLKAGDLKAPMPGMVLKIMVDPGDEIKKGDNLVILEAMKMENIIKATADGKITALKIKPGDKVEKNQIMIIF